VTNTVGNASVVNSAVVRQAGEIEVRISASDLWRQPRITLAAPGLLLRVQTLDTAVAVHEQWAAAGVHLHRLPELAEVPRSRAEEWDISIVATLVGRPAMTSMTVMNVGPMPTHLRIGLGPITWLLLDRAAYHSMLEVWERVTRLFD
jgi:hypothetical protein